MARKNTPKVYKRNRTLETKVGKIADELLKNAGLETDCDIFVTDTSNGYCSYRKNMICVPVWAIDLSKSAKYKSSNRQNPKGYDIYYIAHELAHIFTPGHSHDTIFMNMFMNICPEEYQHFEHGYKPRAAKAAGVPFKGVK